MIFDCIDLRANCKDITNENLEIQEKVVIKAMELLNGSPGIILGDDVGMGKTYEVMSIAYLYSQKGKVVILTPSWQHNEKWEKDLKRFFTYNLLRKHKIDKYIGIVKRDAEDKIQEFLKCVEENKIILCPNNIFSNLSRLEKREILWQFANHYDIKGHERRKLFYSLDMGREYEELHKSESHTCSWWLLDWYGDDKSLKDFKKAYDDGKLKAYNSTQYIKQVKYNLINKYLKRISLVIIDEAHKFKNTESVSTKSIVSSFNKKFNKMVFLTATPFQLSPEELINIFKMFKEGSMKSEEAEAFEEELEDIKNNIKLYQNYFELLRKCWSRLEEYEVAYFTGDNNNETPNIKSTAEVIEKLKNVKDELQNGLGRLIIRNYKSKEHRREISGSLIENQGAISLGKENFLSFAFYEKMIFELFKENQRTFIPTVEQTLTSSYDALKQSNFFNKVRKEKEVDKTRRLIVDLVDKSREHPKIRDLVKNVVDAYDKRQKTLIFINRVETANAIEREIEKKVKEENEKKIEKIFGEESTKKYENFKKAFKSTNNILSIAFEENYIYTILGRKSKITQKMYSEIIEKYEKQSKRKTMDYKLLKNIIENVVILNNKDEITVREFAKFRRLVNEEEIVESDENVQETRKITKTLIDKIISYRGVWYYYRDILKELDISERKKLVKELSNFLINDGFLLNVKEEADKTNQEYFNVIADVFKKDTLDIRSSIRRFLEMYKEEQIEDIRQEMIEGLRTRSVVRKLIGGIGEEYKSRNIAGFNTPFFPYILIASKIAEEGLDLQRECSRVIHYDLDWNPATMEQRVGRIDRINSKINRDINTDKDKKLEIFMPYIENTIDKHMYNVIKSREKWFSLILGGDIKGDDYEELQNNGEIKVIPSKLIKELQINLGVK